MAAPAPAVAEGDALSATAGEVPSKVPGTQAPEGAEAPSQYGGRAVPVPTGRHGEDVAPGEPGTEVMGRPSAGSLLSWSLRVSRPRFWMYLFGPYIVGLLAGAPSPGALLDWRALCFGAFFLWPANLFVYGVNDAHDFDTDALNSKKQGYEARLQRSARGRLLALCWASLLPFALLACREATPRACLALGAFVALAHQYSAPPLRAKARPFADSLSNLLYACPGFFGHALAAGPEAGGSVSWPIVGASWCWVAAMHAYSAVPDIEADSRAGLATTATALGARATLAGCAALYALAALLSAPSLGWLSPALGAVYLAAMGLSLRADRESGAQGVLGLYRFFPALNTLAGFLLFWRVAWIKFAPDILAAAQRLHP